MDGANHHLKTTKYHEERLRLGEIAPDMSSDVCTDVLYDVPIHCRVEGQKYRYIQSSVLHWTVDRYPSHEEQFRRHVEEILKTMPE